MSGKFLVRIMGIRQMYYGYLEKAGEQLKLTQLEMNVLLFLANHPEYNTARDLCQLRMIPKSNASNGIRLLERKGMIRIEQDPDNRKILRLFLTEKAHCYVRCLVKYQRKFMDDICWGFGKEEKDMLERIMERADMNAKEAMKNIDKLFVDLSARS